MDNRRYGWFKIVAPIMVARRSISRGNIFFSFLIFPSPIGARHCAGPSFSSAVSTSMCFTTSRAASPWFSPSSLWKRLARRRHHAEEKKWRFKAGRVSFFFLPSFGRITRPEAKKSCALPGTLPSPARCPSLFPSSFFFEPLMDVSGVGSRMSEDERRPCLSFFFFFLRQRAPMCSRYLQRICRNTTALIPIGRSDFPFSKAAIGDRNASEVSRVSLLCLGQKLNGFALPLPFFFFFFSGGIERSRGRSSNQRKRVGGLCGLFFSLSPFFLFVTTSATILRPGCDERDEGTDDRRIHQDRPDVGDE